ncbi:facilitated trehalose transporter Tret1-2 homolog isoform X2 [Tigriopus californicus]|uniref:facilitated trehalose transporter Tret1-2 homolog isoform X2 n=1 Tax=Tigriopus californicus TaxID=6832 RepID=UPI0027D9F0F8|nr:facilitated trehalose transporter Tret1-2 homolog isoform X2 [Tigriopus californicus]
MKTKGKKRSALPQLLAAVSVSTGCISYGICMAYTSSAIPSMLAPNNSLTIEIGTQETTWMSSLLALGALFGSLSAVYLMDAIGRKASLLAFSVMSLFIGWTLLMASSQTWQLYAGRFLLGLGAGLEITISPVYIHEICRPVLRDICGSFPQVFISLGILLCYIMGRSLEWNWLALASCVFLCPFTFGLYFIPESPPWLVYNDEEDLAFKSMVLIRGEEYDATVEIRKIKEKLAFHRNDLHAILHETDADNLDHEGGKPKFQCWELLHSSVFYPFIVILVLMFLLQFSGQGAITFYTAMIFKEAECVLSPKDCAFIIGITYFLSSILGLVLKKHCGRRRLLLISEFGMAVAQLSMGLYFYLLKADETVLDPNVSSTLDEVDEQGEDATVLLEDPSHPQALSGKTNWAALTKLEYVRLLPIPILVLFTLAYNIGMGSLTWVVATEILPLRSRRWTQTISNVTSNFWWFVVTKTFHDMYYNVAPFVPFFLYGSVCVFGFIFIFIFLPETHGKTAEETAKAFHGLRPMLKRLKCPNLCPCLPLRKLKAQGNATTASTTTTPHNQPPQTQQQIELTNSIS